MRPSLAQVVAEQCSPRWRRMDEVMERLEDAGVKLAEYRPRKGGRPATPEWKFRRIRELLAAGVEWKAIASELRVGKAAIQRVRKDMKEGR